MCPCFCLKIGYCCCCCCCCCCYCCCCCCWLVGWLVGWERMNSPNNKKPQQKQTKQRTHTQQEGKGGRESKRERGEKLRGLCMVVDIFDQFSITLCSNGSNTICTTHFPIWAFVLVVLFPSDFAHFPPPPFLLCLFSRPHSLGIVLVVVLRRPCNQETALFNQNKHKSKGSVLF